MNAFKKIKLLSILEKNSVRIAIFIVLALLTTLLLFYLMSALISKVPSLQANENQTGLIEFIRHKPQSFLQEKIRRLPEKKGKKLKPPPMKHMPLTLPKAQKQNLKTNLLDMRSILKGDRTGIGVGLGQGIGGSGGNPLVRIEPQYPRKAAIQKIEGWVILKFTISKSGGVTDVKVLDSKPSKIFDRVALQALLKWKYQPRIEDGIPVEQKGLKVRLDFTLE